MSDWVSDSESEDEDNNIFNDNHKRNTKHERDEGEITQKFREDDQFTAIGNSKGNSRKHR